MKRVSTLAIAAVLMLPSFAQAASIVDQQGRNFVEIDGTPSTPASDGESLSAGDLVIAKGGEVTISLADGCVVRVPKGDQYTIPATLPCAPGATYTEANPLLVAGVAIVAIGGVVVAVTRQSKSP